MTTAEKTLRDRMILNARAYNKALTNDYMNKLSTDVILNFTHVLDRGDFTIELEKIRRAENVNV